MTERKFISLQGDRVKTAPGERLPGREWDPFSDRWLKIHEEAGALTVSGGATPDFESANIDIFPYDEIIVEFFGDTSDDVDLGVRFIDSQGDLILTQLNIRDYDTAAVLDLAAIYQQTALDVSGAGGEVVHYILDTTVPKFKIRGYVENDAGALTANYILRVFARRLWK